MNNKRQRHVEAALHRKIHITHFPSDVAGSPINSATDVTAGYHQYEAMLPGAVADNGVNYAPFASRLEWDLARWAKLRGPGSNAMAELLKIEGVRHILTAVLSVFLTLVIE